MWPPEQNGQGTPLESENRPRLLSSHPALPTDGETSGPASFWVEGEFGGLDYRIPIGDALHRLEDKDPPPPWCQKQLGEVAQKVGNPRES